MSLIDCMIIGDSIAVGTAQVRTECVAYATGGINSWGWNKKYAKVDLNASTMIISLGTNDHNGVHTFKELSDMRSTVKADRVFWILPAIKPHIQDMVKIIAKNYGDTVISTQRLQKDAIHPSWAGYKELAKLTKE